MSEFVFDFSKEAAAADAELAGDIAKLSPLTEAEVKALLPNPVDQKKLKELIRVVREATDQNAKIAVLTDNISQLGGVVVTLLTKYLKPV